MTVSLKLDAHGVITAVGGAWTAFAEENGGGGTCGEGSVVGRRLLDFVKGDATRMWLEVMLQHARISGRPLERPYRCDSPGEKRYMLMRVLPRAEGFDIEHEVVRTETMRQPVQLVFERVEPARARRRCSLCNRIETEGAWYEPDDLDGAGRQRFPGPQPVVHVLCPVCEGTR